LFKAGLTTFIFQPFDVDELESEICKIKSLRTDYDNKVNLQKQSCISYQICCESNVCFIGSVCHNVSEIIRTANPAANSKINSIILCISEALQNAMMHGNKNNTLKKVWFQFQMDAEKIVIIIKDEGEGFDFINVNDPTEPEFLLKESGRGIFLIKMHIDEVNYYQNGKCIEMIKYL